MLIACPSNKAADTALSSFLRTYGKQNKHSRAVRFVGGYQSFEKTRAAASQDTDMSAFKGIVNPTLANALKANPDHVLHIKLNKGIEKWSTNSKHTQHKEAKTYLDSLAQSNGQLEGSTANDVRKTLGILAEASTGYYVQHEVNIFFATCARACHDTLIEDFKSGAAFLDESGQATIPDICMTIDLYKGSVK